MGFFFGTLCLELRNTSIFPCIMAMVSNLYYIYIHIYIHIYIYTHIYIYMFLNEDIVDIYKPDRTCLLTFVVDKF